MLRFCILLRFGLYVAFTLARNAAADQLISLEAYKTLTVPEGGHSCGLDVTVGAINGLKAWGTLKYPGGTLAKRGRGTREAMARRRGSMPYAGGRIHP